MISPSWWRSVIARRPLLVGAAIGIALTLTARSFINDTRFADRLVEPLNLPDTNGRGDAIVVLAAGITANCAPNLHGLQRVLMAARLFHEGRAPYLVISGGRSARSSCSAAEGMGDLALRLGVPADRIRLEEASTSTWQNALRSDAVLRALGARRIVLVTDRPHLRRAEACFRRFGYAIERSGVPVYLSHFDNMEMLRFGIREYAAMALYRWRGYISDEPAPAALVDAVPVDGAVPQFADTPDPPVRSTGPVVILGASYARGWNPTPSPGLRFVNEGVSGEQSFEMRRRFDADVVARNARAVIIWGFVNDIFRSPRSEIGEALARVRQSYIDMLNRSRANGITPILVSEVTLGPRAGVIESAKLFAGDLLGRQPYMDYVNRHVLDTNAWLRELAIRRDILFLDAQRVLADDSGRRHRVYAADDGSHLTGAAYDALTAYGEPLLREHLAPGE